MHKNLEKFGRVVFELWETTDRQRHILITILRSPPTGEVKNAKPSSLNFEKKRRKMYAQFWGGPQNCAYIFRRNQPYRRQSLIVYTRRPIQALRRWLRSRRELSLYTTQSILIVVNLIIPTSCELILKDWPLMLTTFWHVI